MKSPVAVFIREFQPADAEGISALFSVVYAERYVYPDVYLPSMVRQYNSDGRWRAAVATMEGRIVGHALLCQDLASAGSAELAMIVTHPSTRGMGIATRLSKYLCLCARQKGLDTLSIKMVSSHIQTQRLARALGFHTTGLLLDYVASPFGHDGSESVLIGVLPIKERPIPQYQTDREHGSWLKRLIKYFGADPLPTNTYHPDRMMRISCHGKRIDLTLENASVSSIDEIIRFPGNRLIHLHIGYNKALPPFLPLLHLAGYKNTGLAPGPAGRWYWLLQRGYSIHNLELLCPVSQELYRELR